MNIIGVSDILCYSLQSASISQLNSVVNVVIFYFAKELAPSLFMRFLLGISLGIPAISCCACRIFICSLLIFCCNTQVNLNDCNVAYCVCLRALKGRLQTKGCHLVTFSLVILQCY